MVADISPMGVVELRGGLQNDPLFPPVMEVQQRPPHTARRLAAGAKTGPRVDLSTIA